MNDTMPPFMSDDSQRHIRQSMEEAPEIWIEAARFDSMRALKHPERLAHILAAQDVARSQSIGEWRHEASSHPHDDLARGGKTAKENPDKLARAYFLALALRRLLELVDAPSSIADDLQDVLGPHLSTKSDCRAKLQKVLIDRPELSDNKTALSAETGCDRRLIARYLKDGSVQLKP
ncbi:hypothetical protein [Novosphingopyxis sp.]|uniref:hypothetical protein n=1 Tax=Novosphingopyxis sp. TaxID=2709690 RepID=UPI003B5CE4A1